MSVAKRLATMNIGAVPRRALILLGTLAAVLGIATAILVQPFADILPSTWVIVLGAAVVAFILGVYGMRSRYHGGVTHTQIRDVEVPMATPAPGDDIDRMLYQLTHLRQGTIEYREGIQERLAEAAIAVIRHRENCSREAAMKQLQDGTWTDDEMAASFFSGGSGPQESFADKILGSDESPYEQWVRETVNAIAARAELDPSVTQAAIQDDDDEEGLLDKLLGSSDTVEPRGVQETTEDLYDEADEVADGVFYKELVATGTWRGVTGFSLFAAGVGIFTFTPPVLLLSVVGLGLAAYARLGSSPPLSQLEVERHVDEEMPQPGEEIEVTVAVSNPTDTFMTDVRFVDWVPEPMRVSDGSPRMATALRPGAETSFSYTLVAERGTHEWPLVVLGRDYAGSYERQAIVEVDDPVVNCVPSLRTTGEMAVRSQTSLYSGQVNTAEGGAGLEFFAVREYIQGDPMNRIDWKRHARTGELATIDFRQERAAQVVLLFDARDSAYVSPVAGERHALDRCVDAANEVFAALNDEGNLVGVAAYDTVPLWIGPSAGDDHKEQVRQAFAKHPALSTVPPDGVEEGGRYVDPMVHVRRQLSPEAQIMLFSPLTDDYTAQVARRLDSAGHLVTILSPDPTADRTVGQRLARVERKMRVASLREHGIRVVDWQYDEPLGLDLERAQQRWAV